MSNGLVSIIIVTAGKGRYLDALLNSINKQALAPLETIIIDNSAEHRINVPAGAATVYTAATNLFYCQALNTGIKMSKGEFVLCLNDDVVLKEDFIAEALRGFALSDRIGMVSAKVLRLDGKKIDSAGLSLSIWMTARERGYGMSRTGRFNKPGYIFGVNGAVAFYRRKMLEDIKIAGDYFDADFRIFYEDLDIAWRAQNSGWKCYYVPAALAFHARGGTVRGGRGIAEPFARRYLSAELHLYLLKNRHAAIVKNASIAEVLLRLPFILLYDLASLVYLVFSHPALLKKAFRDFSYLDAALVKRKMIGNILTRKRKKEK